MFDMSGGRRQGALAARCNLHCNACGESALPEDVRSIERLGSRCLASAASIRIEEDMAKAKRTVRKHSVSASVQIHELTKAGTSIDFEIFSGAEKIGTIVIGRGSLTWFGRNRRRAIELNWTRFAKLMDEQYG